MCYLAGTGPNPKVSLKDTKILSCFLQLTTNLSIYRTEQSIQSVLPFLFFFLRLDGVALFGWRALTWASPSEKSKEKGQCQKVTGLCLNMKEDKSTGHNSTYLASFFVFLGIFWPYWVWAKKRLFFWNQISKIDIITSNQNFVIPNYIVMTNILIFISFFDQPNTAGQNLTSNAVFTIKVPEKNALLGSCHQFQ